MIHAEIYLISKHNSCEVVIFCCVLISSDFVPMSSRIQWMFQKVMVILVQKNLEAIRRCNL